MRQLSRIAPISAGFPTAITPAWPSMLLAYSGACEYSLAVASTQHQAEM